MSEEVKFVKDNEILEHVYVAPGGYRNFRGERTENNKAGNRVFSVFLPREVGEYLIDIGWNVKVKPPYREGDDDQFQLDIFVSYDTKGGKFPVPIVKTVSYDGVEAELTQETVGMLDTADIIEAKVEIRPYNWHVNDKRGCKAMLHEITAYLRKPRRALNASLRIEEEE